MNHSEGHQPERRLAAILSADIAGYSRLMGSSEDLTVRDLRAHQAILLPLVENFRGTVVDTAGDGILAAFPSAVRAVECALAIQRTMDERNENIPDARQMLFRIGVSLGDVIHQDGRIFGNGVNVAARIAAIADPGGVALSGTVFEHVRGKVECTFEFLGEHSLKNIEHPTPVYHVSGSIDPLSARAVTATPSSLSIAILPFDNMTTDPNPFFADGLTEEITTALSKLKHIFVIARNTMFTYQGKPVNVMAVGRELGVRYLLEGSVRRSGDKIRVTAQLIDGRTGAHLWGERYDRALDDIFAVQDEITSAVVGRIGPELLVAEYARAARKQPESLDAWECTLRALFQSSRLSDEGSREAIALLDRALRSDPAYAQALGLKAWIVVWRAVQGWEDMGLAVAEAKALAARAIAADEEEPWTWIGHGCVGIGTRDDGLTTSALTRAVELNPNFAMGLGLLGLAHAFGGRSSEAVACVDRAVRLSPREFFQGAFAQQYAFAHFQGGNYDLGLEAARRAHQLRPGHPYPMVIGAACAGFVGEIRLAAELLSELQEVVPALSGEWVEKTAPYTLPADRRRLIEGLQKAGLPS